ncbi:hypothetical protein BDW75DRAFT_220539 [Aspergillus navahoensis]
MFDTIHHLPSSVCWEGISSLLIFIFIFYFFFSLSRLASKFGITKCMWNVSSEDVNIIGRGAFDTRVVAVTPGYSLDP